MTNYYYGLSNEKSQYCYDMCEKQSIVNKPSSLND